MNRAKQLFVIIALIVSLVAGGLTLPQAFAEGGEPNAGTVQGVTTYAFYPATALTGSGTVYSAAPRQQSGQDITLVKNWNAVEVFATVDISSTGTITVTPQFSPDQSTWADAEYLVHTFNTSGTLTTNRVKHQLVLSADGSDYIRLPVSMEYMRLQIEHSASVTPTVWATLRNN